MDKKISVVVGKAYLNNRLFDVNNPILNRDGSLEIYLKLKREFDSRGYILNTDDITPSKESIGVLYFDMPKHLPKQNEIKKSFLLAMESPLVMPSNFYHKNFRYFNKILTWNDLLIDNSKFIKLNYCQNVPEKIEYFDKSNFLTFIASNKKSINDQNDLIKMRNSVVKWFDCNHPNEFSLYGSKWDKRIFGNRILDRIPVIGRTLAYKYNTYKGKVEKKSEIYNRTKFAICFENAKYPGYISEKIFDSIYSGCVPIYLGAPNIQDYIPKDLFIDMRDFKSYDELNNFISTMTDSKYKDYIKKYNGFIKSNEIQCFSTERFVNTIVDTVLVNI